MKNGAKINEKSIKKRGAKKHQKNVFFPVSPGGPWRPRTTTIQKTSCGALQKNYLQERKLQKVNLQEGKLQKVNLQKGKQSADSDTPWAPSGPVRISKRIPGPGAEGSYQGPGCSPMAGSAAFSRFFGVSRRLGPPPKSIRNPSAPKRLPRSCRSRSRAPPGPPPGDPSGRFLDRSVDAF